jgi:CheY-like chemotaxis protein
MTDKWQRGLALRILVIDDNKPLADIFALALRACGHEVRVAYDGPSALQAAVMQPPDVVITDLVLPGMDGYELAKRIREQFAAQKRPVLIALTGYGDESDRRRSKAEGFHFHFMKPVEPALLEDVLEGLAGETLSSEQHRS